MTVGCCCTWTTRASSMSPTSPRSRRAGADWLGVADAFWWHDGWLQLAGAAAVTERIELGLAVTNPPICATPSTLSRRWRHQALAGERVFSLAAGVPRSAPPPVWTVATPPSGSWRSLSWPRRRRRTTRPRHRPSRGLAPGGPADPRGRSRCARAAPPERSPIERLWAVSQIGAERSAQLIRAVPVDRDDGPPTIVWSPIVDHDGSARRSLAYAVLNSRRSARQRWGVDEALATTIAEVAVRDGNAARRWARPRRGSRRLRARPRRHRRSRRHRPPARCARWPSGRGSPDGVLRLSRGQMPCSPRDRHRHCHGRAGNIHHHVDNTGAS